MILQSFSKAKLGLIAAVFLPLLFVRNTDATSIAPPRAVDIGVKLSQTRFVQNEANTVYLDLNIRAPDLPSVGLKPRATDMIIVLDHSGSMSEDNKMPYAKAAVWDIIGRLNERDRFALVSFSDNATVESPLVTTDSAHKGVLNNLVSQVVPSGSTNMSDGLNAALQLLEHSVGEGARKIVLLSDGQANQGITDPELLGQMAARATQRGAVLSTIGMGLGFNESLMAKLADHGMGHYSYMEDLSGLAGILNRDLNETRQIYASSSTLEIRLAAGVRLLDAGGYPVSTLNASTISIPTGQLLAGSAKHLVMTFTVPNATVGNLALGEMKLNYNAEGAAKQVAFDQAKLQLAVVAPERRQEALQSIDKDVYQQSWIENNLGLVKKKISDMVRSGNQPAAKQAISDYRKEVKAAEAAASVPLADAKMDEKLKKMEAEVDDAFTGSAPEQDVKRNRAAKSMQYEGIKAQRKIK